MFAKDHFLFVPVAPLSYPVCSSSPTPQNPSKSEHTTTAPPPPGSSSPSPSSSSMLRSELTDRQCSLLELSVHRAGGSWFAPPTVPTSTTAKVLFPCSFSSSPLISPTAVSSAAHSVSSSSTAPLSPSSSESESTTSLWSQCLKAERAARDQWLSRIGVLLASLRRKGANTLYVIVERIDHWMLSRSRERGEEEERGGTGKMDEDDALREMEGTQLAAMLQGGGGGLGGGGGGVNWDLTVLLRHDCAARGTLMLNDEGQLQQMALTAAQRSELWEVWREGVQRLRDICFLSTTSIAAAPPSTPTMGRGAIETTRRRNDETSTTTTTISLCVQVVPLEWIRDQLQQQQTGTPTPSSSSPLLVLGSREATAALQKKNEMIHRMKMWNAALKDALTERSHERRVDDHSVTNTDPTRFQRPSGIMPFPYHFTRRNVDDCGGPLPEAFVKHFHSQTKLSVVSGVEQHGVGRRLGDTLRGGAATGGFVSVFFPEARPTAVPEDSRMHHSASLNNNTSSHSRLSISTNGCGSPAVASSTSRSAEGGGGGGPPTTTSTLLSRRRSLRNTQGDAEEDLDEGEVEYARAHLRFCKAKRKRDRAGMIGLPHSGSDDDDDDNTDESRQAKRRKWSSSRSDTTAVVVVPWQEPPSYGLRIAPIDAPVVAHQNPRIAARLRPSKFASGVSTIVARMRRNQSVFDDEGLMDDESDEEEDEVEEEEEEGLFPFGVHHSQSVAHPQQQIAKQEEEQADFGGSERAIWRSAAPTTTTGDRRAATCVKNEEELSAHNKTSRAANHDQTTSPSPHSSLPVPQATSSSISTKQLWLTSEQHRATASAVATSESHNQQLLDHLAAIRSIYQAKGDAWRVYAYNRAIGVIKRIPFRVEHAKQLEPYHGIGEKIRMKIEEVLRTGTSRKLEHYSNDPMVKAVASLTKIWGVGPSTAQKLARQLVREDVLRTRATAQAVAATTTTEGGSASSYPSQATARSSAQTACLTPSLSVRVKHEVDVDEDDDNGVPEETKASSAPVEVDYVELLRQRTDVLAQLTPFQRIGLRHYEDLQQRMPRSEVDVILAIVRRALLGVVRGTDLPPTTTTTSASSSSCSSLLCPYRRLQSMKTEVQTNNNSNNGSLERNSLERDPSSRREVGVPDDNPSPLCGSCAIEAMTDEQVSIALEAVVDVVACGSYRRGKSTCGDIDILLCDRRGERRDEERTKKALRTNDEDEERAHADGTLFVRLINKLHADAARWRTGVTTNASTIDCKPSDGSSSQCSSPGVIPKRPPPSFHSSTTKPRERGESKVAGRRLTAPRCFELIENLTTSFRGMSEHHSDSWFGVVQVAPPSSSSSSSYHHHRAELSVSFPKHDDEDDERIAKREVKREQSALYCRCGCAHRASVLQHQNDNAPLCQSNKSATDDGEGDFAPTEGKMLPPPRPTRDDAISTRYGRGLHVCRRLDIKLYPPSQFPFAVLYFTGSDYFNRSMRLYCQKHGWSLSDKDLKPVIRSLRTGEKVHETGRYTGHRVSPGAQFPHHHQEQQRGMNAVGNEGANEPSLQQEIRSSAEVIDVDSVTEWCREEEEPSEKEEESEVKCASSRQSAVPPSLRRTNEESSREGVWCRTERDIFTAIGLPYKEPWERDL